VYFHPVPMSSLCVAKKALAAILVAGTCCEVGFRQNPDPVAGTTDVGWGSLQLFVSRADMQ